MPMAQAATHDGVIDVRWDETIYPDEALKAANIADFKGLLEANWNEKISVIVKKDSRSATEKLSLQNCRQLFNVERHLYETEDPTDWPILMQSLLRCKAMQMMTRLKPAQTSYMDRDVLSMVRDLAGLQPESRSDPIRLFFSGLREEKGEKNCFRKNLCRIVTAKNAYLLNVVATGDYNGDGIEDLILIATNGPIGGTATSRLSLGFVLTREAPGKPLKILTSFEKAN